jgi:hypothetical protein
MRRLIIRCAALSLLAVPLNAQVPTAVSVAGSAAQLEPNLASAPRSTVVATLADSTFWPEGVDFDPRTRRYGVPLP